MKHKQRATLKQLDDRRAAGPAPEPGYRCPELATLPVPNRLVGSLWPTGPLMPPCRNAWTQRSRAARPPLPTPTQCDKRRGLLPHQSWWPRHPQPLNLFSAASTPACLQHPPLQPTAQGCLVELTLCLRQDGGPARGPCQWGQHAARGSGAPPPAPQTLPTKHPPWPRRHQPSPRQPRSAQSRRRGPSVPPQWGPLLRIAPSTP